ncbi:MAG: hypothetical protein IJ141_10835, partial [Lachnospiraceae bacterium]|nr:hypothetical protein [Lachnospiraceae bacterium]
MINKKMILRKIVAIVMTGVFLLNDTSIIYAAGNATEIITEGSEDNNTEIQEGDTVESTQDDTIESTQDDTVESTKDDTVESTSDDTFKEESVLYNKEEVNQPENASYEDMIISSNMTLSEDMVVNNLTIKNRSELNLNGHTLKVMGNISIESGSIYLNSGELYCEGSLNVEKSGSLKMKDINDYLYVRQALTINGVAELKNGTVEVKGDINAVSDINAEGNNKFVLNGDEKQTVTINENSSFNIIELRNYSDEGIYISYFFKYNQLISNDCMINYSDLEGERGFTLEEDTVIDGMYYLVADTLDLNGFSLTINGDLVHAGGDIRVNGGSLIVNGDYRVQTRVLKEDENNSGSTIPGSEPEQPEYVYEPGAGNLIMNSEDDYVCVYGDYINDNTGNQTGNLTAGTMELKGDFYACFTDNAGNNNLNYSFMPSGSHTVILSGEEKQKVEIRYED